MTTIEHQTIFPTHLFLIEDFYKSDIAEMKKYLFLQWLNRDVSIDRWQTASADLHKQKEFKEFAELVISTSKEILNMLKYDVEDVVITDMWATVLKSEEHHPAHTHSNNFLSGVYYLHSAQGASIVFHDPRPAADVIVPRKTETTVDNSSLLSYASRQNRAIFFPSWLPHWVEQNKSKNNRISISWNIQVKGQVGEHYDFQSADF